MHSWRLSRCCSQLVGGWIRLGACGRALVDDGTCCCAVDVDVDAVGVGVIVVSEDDAAMLAMTAAERREDGGTELAASRLVEEFSPSSSPSSARDS